MVAAKVLGLLAAAFSMALAYQRPPQPGYRLLSVSEKDQFWVPAEVHEVLSNSELNFMDLTDYQDITPGQAPLLSAIPNRPAHQDIIKPLLPRLNMTTYESNLEFFSSYRNRYYTSPTGLESAEWLYKTVSAVVAGHQGVTVSRFSHNFAQFSIIVAIEGSKSQEAVILGAHQDSTAPGMPSGSAPGADDDGSGSMGILEILRVLLNAGFKPEHRLEFHWYAAEESGLLGSQGVAQDYNNRKVPVRSMMQLDMIGYDGKERTVGIVTDYVDPETIAFSRLLVDEYLDIGYTNTVCGYGCSDHASWTRFGYRSCFPFEAQFRNRSPFIHTPMDILSNMSVEHAREFCKLGLAFAVELSYV